MKDKVLYIIRWIIGSFFGIAAFSYAQKGIIPALCFLIIGIFTVPAVTNVPEKIIKKPISSSEKLLICIVLFFIAVATSPKTSSVDNTYQMKEEITPNVTIIETTPEPTETPTPTPTAVVTKAVAIPTVQQVVNKTTVVQPTTATVKIQTPKPTVAAATNTAWICNCSKTCPSMSCAEAQFQLNSCGCSRRDGDNDGVACDSQCQ